MISFLFRFTLTNVSLLLQRVEFICMIISYKQLKFKTFFGLVCLIFTPFKFCESWSQYLVVCVRLMYMCLFAVSLELPSASFIKTKFALLSEVFFKPLFQVSFDLKVILCLKENVQNTMTVLFKFCCLYFPAYQNTFFAFWVCKVSLRVAMEQYFFSTFFSPQQLNIEPNYRPIFAVDVAFLCVCITVTAFPVASTKDGGLHPQPYPFAL